MKGEGKIVLMVVEFHCSRQVYCFNIKIKSKHRASNMPKLSLRTQRKEKINSDYLFSDLHMCALTCMYSHTHQTHATFTHTKRDASTCTKTCTCMHTQSQTHTCTHTYKMAHTQEREINIDITYTHT